VDGVCTARKPISGNYQLAPVDEVVGHTLDKCHAREDRKAGKYCENLRIAKETADCKERVR